MFTLTRFYDSFTYYSLLACLLNLFNSVIISINLDNVEFDQDHICPYEISKFQGKR